jgi:RNA polymerase sigma factor (sigma-70 family)
MSEPLTLLPGKLDPAAELELVKKIKAGNVDARATLALANMREAISYARRVTGGNIPDSQLASACYDVLWRGAIRFDPKYGKRFFAFCKVGVRGWCRNIWKEREVVKNAKPVDPEAPSVKKFHADYELRDAWDEKDLVTPEHEISEPDFRGIQMRERMRLIMGVSRKICTVKERQILGLTYFAGFNFQETADLIGVSRAAVQGMNSKALHKIRGELYRKKRLFND